MGLYSLWFFDIVVAQSTYKRVRSQEYPLRTSPDVRSSGTADHIVSL